MSKKVQPIVIETSDGKEYTLEFNRSSVVYAEEHGFVMADMETKPVSSITKLIMFAFRMHHPTMQQNAILNIIDNQLGGIGALPDGFAERLAELYVAPFEALKDDENPPKATIRM